MHFATYIFNANSHQLLVPTIMLHFARQPLLFCENSGGHFEADMRNEQGRWGEIRGGSEIFRCDPRMWTLGVGSTRQLLAMRQGRRIAPLIPPGYGEEAQDT